MISLPFKGGTFCFYGNCPRLVYVYILTILLKYAACPYGIRHHLERTFCVSISIDFLKKKNSFHLISE